MSGFSRPFGSLVCCGGALGVAVAGTWAVGSTRTTPDVVMPPVAVTALPPLPSRDSLAALLVSPGSARTSRGTTRILLEAVAIIDWVPSSSERAELLADIAQFPELDSAVVAAVARSSARLSSPGTRARVLRTLIRNHRVATAEARAPVLDAIAGIHSTPERVVSLEVFVTSHRLSAHALLDALVHIERLRTESERSRVLVAAARAQRITGRAQTIYIRAAASMHEGRHRRRALAAIGRESAAHIPHRP
jgi:hypothetical protein